MKRLYKFSDPAITATLAEYEIELAQKQFSSNYLRQNVNYTGAFLAWLKEESLAIEQVTYREMLDYADQLGKDNHQPGHINRNLVAIRYYFEQLQREGKVQANPVAGLHLKGRASTLPQGLLSKEELTNLYENYPVTDNRTSRNKIMLSLLMNQGLATEELHQLKTAHIKLKEGRLTIPAGKQSNSRVLKLEGEQIMALYEYIQEIRPKILAEQQDPTRPGRKPNSYKKAEQVSQLFISINGCESIKNSIKYLILALKKHNPKVKNAQQIRQSVITEWLKEKDLRTVQYMAGHRYVSSTERYRESNLEELKEAIGKHHPLR